MEDLLDRHELMQNRSMAALVNRGVAFAKLAGLRAAAAAADPSFKLPADPQSLEQIFARRLASLPAERRAKAAAHARRVFAATTAVRTRSFRELAVLDPKPALAVSERASAATFPIAFDAAEFIAALPAAAAPPPPPPSPGGPPNKALQVRIRRVICEDETDAAFGSEAGHDEIGMGGVSIDETGAVKKISAFTVGTNFDDGDKKVYDPPKVFETWDLNEGSRWPKPYTLAIYLSELDNGGFPSFLSETIGGVKTYLLSLLGGAIGSLGGPLAAAIGAALGFILDVLISWLISIWEDDIFPAITIATNIKSFNHTFASGTQTSSVKKYWTKAHGGKYWVWLDWRIVNG